MKAIRRREAVLHIQLAERNLEGVELRRELNTAWSSADPNVIQLKQLLLDPALNKEFSRLKAELESTQKELKHVQQELAATSFTQESKIGRQLMAKCRALADENEEMGRELSEGEARDRWYAHTLRAWGVWGRTHAVTAVLRAVMNVLHALGWLYYSYSSDQHYSSLGGPRQDASAGGAAGYGQGLCLRAAHQLHGAGGPLLHAG